MRRLAALLMGLGVAVGVAGGLGILFAPTFAGLQWLIAVGLVKLTLAGSFGLIAGGAVVRRLAIRAEMRDLSLPRSDTERGTGDRQG